MSYANQYLVDEVVECDVAITVNGTLTDPDTLQFRYKDPSDNITTLVYGIDGAVVKTSTGRYEATFAPDEPGDWYYGFFGTGAAAGGGYKRIYANEVPV